MTDLPDRLRDYIPVADRITAFLAKHPDGSLQSDLIELSDHRVVMRGYAYRHPDDPRPGIGYSSMPIPAKNAMLRDSEIETCETSAWGRAIAALGFEVKKGVASRNEIEAKSGPRELEDPLIGIAEAGKDAKAFELQQEPTGVLLTFRLLGDKGGIKVEAHDEMALVVKGWREGIEGQRVSCWGRIEDREWTPRGKTKPVVFQVLTLSRIKGADFDFPASDTLAGGSDQEPVRPPEAPGQEAFDLDAVDRETELAEALAS